MAEHLYEHKVHYYETDQMKIVHHSNYVRWFEEARLDWMEQLGIGYDQMEKDGIISPIIEVDVKYKTMTRFGDTVVLKLNIESYNSVKLVIGYTVRDKVTDEIRCTGSTTSCFMNADGMIISLKRGFEKYDQLFRDMMGKKP